MRIVWSIVGALSAVMVGACMLGLYGVSIGSSDDLTRGFCAVVRWCISQ